MIPSNHFTTFTIIPFMPDGWAASAGGFPAMGETVAFLMKDLVPLAVSFYLLTQDLRRETHAALKHDMAAPKERLPSLQT
jgi:uncharacterized membrane protein YkgB